MSGSESSEQYLGKSPPQDALMGEPGIDSPRAPQATPPPENFRDWREEIVTVSGLNLLAGLWLIVSPFVLGFQVADATWNPVVFGAIVVALAVTRMTVPASRTVWVSMINALIGVWLFVSAFWLAVSAEAITNAWIMGMIVFGFAIWSGATTGADRQTARG